MTLAATLAAASRVLAVSFDARTDSRSLIGLPPAPRRLASLSMPDIGQRVMSEAMHGDERNVLAPAHNGFGLQADQFVTGSIGNPGSLLQAPSLSPNASFALAPKREDASAQPLPRARPKLAALPSASDAAIQIEDDNKLAKTAIYDITAQTVYLPNGEKLEAHSGFGPYMDKPSSSRLKMRGVTPPNTYTLKLRESLFHGVQAIRMTPVNQREMYGRDGILAHSYLLGPNGQSHGCVSFKDYPKFLRAFMRGEVERIVVVGKLDQPPVFARRNVKSASAL